MALDDRSSVKDQIFKAIQDSENKDLKAILAMMYGSLTYTDEAVNRIEQKIDALRHDEITLKKLVLNGYNDKHHIHHEWLDRRMGRDVFLNEFMEGAVPAIEWVEGYKLKEKEVEPICTWAKQTMTESAELKKDKKALFMKFLSGAVNHVGTALATALMAWFMWGPK